jgi:hypothetical protein
MSDPVESDRRIELERIARMLMLVLQETYDWCGYDAPNWREIDAALFAAKDAGITDDT